MKKITALTTEQAKLLPVFRRKWFDIGTCTLPADRPKTESAITEMYKLIGKEPPRFLWFDSPMACNLALNFLKNAKVIYKKEELWGQLGSQLESQLRGQLRGQLESQLESQLWSQDTNNFYGQHSSAWIAFYLFCHDIGVKYPDKELATLKLWSDLAESVMWWWPYDGMVICCERPEFIKWDASGTRLHNEQGMSVKFRDGWGIYSWNGTPIPSEWIEQKEKLTPQIALNWENVEQRRAACEILKWENVLEHPSLNSRVIDEDLPHIGKLIEVDLPDAPKQWFLKYQCGTGRFFAEPVNDKSFNTALKANAGGNGWRGHGDPESYIPFIRS